VDEATADVVKFVSVHAVVPLGVPTPNPIPDVVEGLTLLSVTATGPAPAVNVKKAGAPCGLSEPENVVVVVESLGDVDDPGSRLHPPANKAATIGSHLVQIRTPFILRACFFNAGNACDFFVVSGFSRTEIVRLKADTTEESRHHRAMVMPAELGRECQRVHLRHATRTSSLAG
jgi:hypothetical protein